MADLTVVGAGLTFLLIVAGTRPAAPRAALSVNCAFVVLLVAVNPTVTGSVAYFGLFWAVSILALGAVLTSPAPQTNTAFRISIAFGSVAILATLARGLPNLSYQIGLMAVLTLATLLGSRFGRVEKVAFERFVIVVAITEALAGLSELWVGAPLVGGYGPNGVALPNELVGVAIPRIQGSLGHPLPFSVLLTVGVALLLRRPGPRFSPGRIVGLLILAAAIVLSGSRTALVCLLVLALAGSMTKRSTVARASTFVKLVLFGTLLATIFGSRIGDSWAEFRETGSFTNRIEGIQSIPELLDQNVATLLLGNGLGSEPLLIVRGLLQQNGFGVVDNQYLTSLATTGLAGLLLLVAILRLGLRAKDQAATAISLVFVVVGFSFDYLRWPTMTIILFVVVAASGRRYDLTSDISSSVPTQRHS